MAALEAANAELRNTAGAQAEALKLARSTLSSQRGDIDQLRGALEGEATSSRRSAKSDATLAKENRRLSAELSKLKQELADGRIGGNENGLLRDELGKLASQVLAVAKAQGTRLPDFTPPLAPPPALEHGGREPHFGPEPAFVGRNGGDAREELPPPQHEPLAALSAGGCEPRRRPKPSLRRQDRSPSFLSARKARRRGAKGRRTGSLSERLKNLSAESPDS